MMLMIWDGRQTFSVENTGNASKKYKLTHFPAGTALTVNAVRSFIGLQRLRTSTHPHCRQPNSPPSDPSHSSTLPPRSLSSPTHLPSAPDHPKPSLPSSLPQLSPPKGLDAATFSLYSGFIEIAAPSESLHVTYIGLAASLKDKQVVDNSDVFFGEKIPALLDSQGNVQRSPTNYMFVAADVPTLLWRLTFGTPISRSQQPWSF
ncbi:hypothetical protein K443DRAFT_512070 [Laccaria amethystina LaAM-08-1]|uniref:Uncharacterized protein n=1 Tax=Laccaria amethystina LaAM-08-1 TaxID=1095629 RepID=A0A0C9XCP6_9AGAR|nr:hypothetical protein K443DRAFT_512070 [Laccaria amethystina LaAM-08-1]